jgi:hypothetical protein
LGVTPSAWNSTFNVFQIGSTGSLYSRTSGIEQTGIASNAYFASGTNDWRYITSTNATYYLQSGGVHYWLNAASGTAGNAISFTQAMTLDASGNLLVGLTTGGRLSVRDAGGNDTHFGLGANYDNYITAGTSGVTIFRNATTERMRITSGGNVGINTSSPSQLFTVVSTNNNTSSFSGFYALNGSQGVEMWYGGIRMGGSNTDVDFNLSSKGAANLVFNTNSSERMRITSGGNVGIGTSSPSDKLHVVGIINSSTSTVSGTGTLYLGTTSESRIAGRITAAPSPSYSSTGKIGFSVTTWGANTDYGLTEVMAIDMRNPDNKKPVIWMNPFGGNVGIGTTIPNANLEVAVDNASAASDTRIRLSGRGNGAYGGNQYIDFTYQDYGNYGYVYKTASIQSISSTPTGNNGYGTLVFATKNASSAYNADPTEKMRITEGGQVGINISSPQYLLDVNGTGRFTGTITGNNNIELINAFGSYVLVGEGTGASQYGVIDWDATNNRLRIATQPYAFGANGGQITLTTSGNVGIGTTSPADKLDVVGNITLNAGYKFYNGSANNSAGIDFDSSYVSLSGYNGIRFFASNTGVGSMSERMRITSGGEVSIGYTTAHNTLNLYNSTNAGIRLQSPYTGTTSNDGVYIGHQFQSTDFLFRNYENSAFIFETNTSERMRITSGGNVGIGTSSPDRRLTIVGGNGTQLTLDNTGQTYTQQNWKINGTDVGSIWVSNTDFSMYTYSTQPILFYTNGSERMRITSGGNVGIGLTNPSYKLHIVGSTDIINATSTSTDARINIGHSGNGGYVGFANLAAGNASNTFYVTTGSGVIGSGIVMNNAGNVGIGTTTPADKLHVVGTSQISSYTGIGVAPDSSTMVLVKGANTSSTNFAAVFQNSAGTNLVRFFNNGKVNFGALPTSSAGLSSGDLWNDGGTLKIV